MTDTSPTPAAGGAQTSRALEMAFRISLVAILLYWCFRILGPFIIPVLWGIIIAIGVYPAFRRFSAVLGHRDKLAAVLFTLGGLGFLITPTVFLAESAIAGVQTLADGLSDGTLTIPPHPRAWPPGR